VSERGGQQSSSTAEMDDILSHATTAFARDQRRYYSLVYHFTFLEIMGVYILLVGRPVLRNYELFFAACIPFKTSYPFRNILTCTWTWSSGALACYLSVDGVIGPWW
jgi:hypothetical protein